VSIFDLLEQLLRLDVQLWVDDGQLRFSAPPQTMTAELRTTLIERKVELIALLDTAADDESACAACQSADRGMPLPLSFGQERLWFLNQFEQNSAAYNVSFALWMHGPLDVAALQQSFNEIVRRHEALRTTFVSSADSGQVVQVINPAAPLPLPVIDLRQTRPEQRASEARRRAQVEARRPFSLKQGPLLRTTLLRLGPDEYVLLLIMHHIVSDDWSFGVLLRELEQLYRALGANCAPELAAPPIQYADYAAWQRRATLDAARAAQRAYWRRQLADAPALLDLPTDRPRPETQTSAGATHAFTVPGPTLEALVKLSQQRNVTLFMTLLAAFEALLSRYTGQDDLVVGAPMANRSQAETQALIGFFVNTVPLRADLSGDPSFTDLLQRVRETTLAGAAQQDLPLEQIIDALQIERSARSTPLFQTVLTLRETEPTLDLPRLRVTIEEIANGTAKFDLTLALTRSADALRGSLEYNRDLFDAATIARLAQHFCTLLAEAAADPTQRLSQIALLSEAERTQLLTTWNDTRQPYPGEQSIHQLFEAQAARTPDAVALVYGEQQLRYGELNRRANQLAHELRARGVRPDDLVAIAIERSLELIVGLLAILKAGGAYLPLDPSYPHERLQLMLDDARPRLLLTEQRMLSRLPAYPATLRLDAASIAAHPQSNLDSDVGPDHLAYVMYTSGSTGRPKGVSIPHRGVVRLVRGTHYASFSAEEVFLLFAPVSFDASTFEIWGALLNGARLALFPDAIPSIEELGQALRQHQVTTLWLTAGLFHQIGEHSPEILRPLRQLLAGGDVLSAPHVQKLRAQLPDCQLINGYGPTESATFTCCYPIPADDALANGVAIGRPIGNTQAYVLDAQMQPVPAGVVGELYIGGDGLARGYLNRPALTAEKFVPNPFATGLGTGRWGLVELGSLQAPSPRCPAPGARLYRTGDRARYRADGVIEFLGRIDRQIKLRGFRIELGEIESALLQHPAVSAAAALVRQDSPTGAKQLVAYVTLRPEPAATVDDLRSYLRERLPDYMTPAAFMALPELPLNHNGKVDQAALPAPDQPQPAQDESFVAPRSQVERILAEIWSQVLGVAPVGIHHNFFALGGDSILSIQVMSRAAQAGVPLTPRHLFERQTIAELAEVAGNASPIEAEQASVTGEAPLTPIQRWFFARDPRERHSFNQAMLLEARTPLRHDLLEQALRQVARQHDALRLRYHETDAGWQQRLADAAAAPEVGRLDLSALNEPARRAALTAAIAACEQRLNITSGPLLQALLVQRGAEPEQLLIMLHHLVVDGVSWRIVLEDLERVYGQLVQGQPATLPLKTTSFKRWAERLAAYADTPALRQELEYWLAPARVDVQPLPRDGWQAAAQAAPPIVSTLTPAETRALLQDVPSIYRTQINDVLLTALAEAFAAWTGERTLLVQLEGHGREPLFDDVDLSRTVGWFTTAFPVLLDVRAAATIGDALRAVKQQLRQVPQRGIGYGVLRYLSRDPAIGAQLEALPPAEVSLNYLGQFDQLTTDATLLRVAADARGPYHSMQGSRNNLIEINGLIVGGQLQLEWTYDPQQHRPATIQRVARGFEAALRTLIDHSRTHDDVAYTPADFPLAGLDHDALGELALLLDQMDE
jgi:amino acid adenylation domain-containing protein/non-ribosomal peptide synthase protein (TIGR01720 family)